MSRSGAVPTEPRVGVVVIGRNEGLRLQRCLNSLPSSTTPVVYVDSGSTDGSVEMVRTWFPSVTACELSSERAFSAARARNEGARRLVELWPQVSYVQFIDGDCILAGGWLDQADAHLEAQASCAAVVGHLTEMHPEASIYNRLCSMEWASPAGDMEDCGSFGGISMIRASVFATLGGFNSEIIAGEDSEFAARMKLAGHRVTKLAAPMASHDAGMTRFGEFWARSVRSGHAIAQRFDLHGRGPLRDCAKDRKSVFIWGLAVPLASIVLGAVTHGWGLVLWPLGMLWLFGRVSRFRRNLGDSPQDSRTYAAAIVVAKYAQVIGFARYLRRRQNRTFELIEYK